MLTDLLFIAAHFAVCTLFFLIVQRPLFMVYNRSSSPSPMKPSDVFDIYRHGYRTDFIVAAYLTLPVVAVIILHTLVPFFRHDLVLAVLDVVIALAAALASVADTALYKFWQYKIDRSVFNYLRSLKGAFASVSASYIVVALLAWTTVGAIFVAMLMPLGHIYDALPPASYHWALHLPVAVLFAVVGGLLYLVIRGLKRRPQNTSIAYFSNCQYFNHCALNSLFNLIYSLSVKENFSSQFRFFDEDECRRIYAPLFPLEGTPVRRLLNTNRPNIVFVVWESLCAYFTGTLGGDANVCRNIDRLSKQGVYFTNFYSASFRTDRALPCLLSGYMAQPTTSVILYTRKLPHLPGLPRTLRDKAGYQTTAVHGGDLTIFHKCDFYLAVGHDRLVDQTQLPNDAPACSWGIHDHYMFDWLYDDIQRRHESHDAPWFTTLQTLSSHEPFDVPYNRIADDPVKNSFAYTDDAFGQFIDRLRQTPAWDNLLIVVTGDHGINHVPGVTDESRIHLPLLMLGGAVKQPAQIDTICNQSDIAATLLGQMGIDHRDFVFSRDVLADTYKYPFAMHCYNNGFIFRDATGFTNYDNVKLAAIENPDEHREQCGKAILQTLYNDLDKR